MSSPAEQEHRSGDTVIKDSGARRVFQSGAHRDRGTGKGAFNLIPYQAMLEIAQVFEAGGAKYTPNNWRLGMPLSEYMNSAIRHVLKAAQGWTDENHMAQAAWNCICAIQTRWMIAQGQLPKDLDDLHDWLSAEGVKAALEKVKVENDARIASTGRTPGTTVILPKMPEGPSWALTPEPAQPSSN